MKPKIFLRKLLRGGTGIDDVFKMDALSINENEVDNTYISKINLNSDAFTFNEAYVNTYYLHLSIFCYYYIKQTKQDTDRVQFITDSIDKIKDYVKCYVLYKIIIAINSTPKNKDKLINAIKSTDVFDDFDDNSIKFEKDESDFNKMKKILSAIALVIKYSYDTNFDLNYLCSNYGEFTTSDSDKLSKLNEYLTTAQSNKNGKKSQEKTAVEKRDILEDIKKEVKDKLKSLRDKLFDKYKVLKSTPDSEATQISDLKIADIIAKAILILSDLGIAPNLDLDSKLSKLFSDFDKLMDDDKISPLLKEVKELKENPNDKNKKKAFHKHFYEEYLKSELLKLNEEEINSYLNPPAVGGKKKVKKSKGGNQELFGKIQELTNANDILLINFKDRAANAKGLFDQEKRKNERIESIRKRLSSDENQNLLSMKRTYEILAGIGSMENDDSLPLDIDIERMSDDFKSMAINYKKVSILKKKLMESTLSSADEEELLTAKKSIIKSINQEFTQTDLEDIRTAIDKLNELQSSINDADTIIDIATKFETGGKRRKNKKGGIGDDPSTINDIQQLTGLIDEQTATLNQNRAKLEEIMNISNDEIQKLNEKIREISLKTSERDEFNSGHNINEKIVEFNESIRKQKEEFDSNIEHIRSEITQYEASNNETMGKLNLEKQKLLENIRYNIAALKKQKQAITTLIENLKQILRRKGEIIQQRIKEEQDAIDNLESRIIQLREEQTSRNSIIENQTAELESHVANLKSLESERLPANIDAEYRSYDSLIYENPIELIIDADIKKSLGSDDIPEKQEESDGVKQVKDLKEKVGKIIEKLKDVFNERANYSIPDFNNKDSELFVLIQTLITKLREIYDIEIGTRPLDKIDGIRDMIKAIIDNKIVINEGDDKSLIDNLINHYYNNASTDLFKNFKTTLSNLNKFDFSFENYLASLKDIDDDQESNMKALLVIIRIIVDLYNLIHREITKTIYDITDATKRTEEETKNKKREDVRIRKAAEELERIKLQDAENERLRREALDKRRQELARMQSQQPDADKKRNYFIMLKDKLDTVISINYKLPKTVYSDLFGLIRDFDFQRSAGNEIQKTKFDTLKAEVSKLLRSRLSAENKRFLESLVVLHPVSRGGTTVFDVKKVHNLTTEYTIDSISDIPNNSLEITHKGQPLKFLKDKDGTKIKYLKINETGNVFIDIGFLSIPIKFELLSSPGIDLDEDLRGGALNTDTPNNIFNAYIIMVMNKIMEMGEADLKDFTIKAQIAVQT